MKPTILFMCLCILSCSKETNEERLIGVWEQGETIVENNNLQITYKKVKKVNQKIALVFEGGNTFKHWQFGWCGTPPHTYYFNTGTYTLIGEKLEINLIDELFYPQYNLEVMEIESKTLKINFKKK